MHAPHTPIRVSLSLPEWLDQLYPALDKAYPTDEDKMRLAIDLSARNTAAGTGGPFGAALFEEGDGRLIAVGVNQVVALGNSAAHAEMMAFMLAQHRLGRHRLESPTRSYVLATSAQPCSMCYGAAFWAGISRLLIGARRTDVEGLAKFDEGPLPRNWIRELAQRGISVQRDLLRAEACAVLRAHGLAAGPNY